jgi:coatomer subunit beta'
LTVKFLAQKQWIVAGGGDGRIYVYSYNTMKRVKSFRALSNQITSLAIHPTEPYVLSASYDLVIKMWDWENGWKSTRKFEDAHSSSVMQIAFNPNDAKAFASVSKDYTLKVCV